MLKKYDIGAIQTDKKRKQPKGFRTRTDIVSDRINQ